MASQTLCLLFLCGREVALEVRSVGFGSTRLIFVVPSMAAAWVAAIRPPPDVAPNPPSTACLKVDGTPDDTRVRAVARPVHVAAKRQLSLCVKIETYLFGRHDARTGGPATPKLVGRKRPRCQEQPEPSLAARVLTQVGRDNACLATCRPCIDSALVLDVVCSRVQEVMISLGRQQCPEWVQQRHGSNTGT